MEVLTILHKQFKNIRKDKGEACADGDSEGQKTEHAPHKWFRCGYVDHLVTKCPKPPKDNEKRQKTVCFNENGNHASQK